MYSNIRYVVHEDDYISGTIYLVLQVQQFYCLYVRPSLLNINIFVERNRIFQNLIRSN